MSQTQLTYESTRIISGSTRLATNVSQSNVNQSLVVVNVFSSDSCKFTVTINSLDSTDNYCVNGDFIDGICQCHKYWAGSNCDRFNFELVNVVAVSAAAMIFGILLTGAISFFCLRQSAAKAVTSQNRGVQGGNYIVYS